MPADSVAIAPPQEKTRPGIYGAYTVADVWTMVQAEISGLDGDRPRMTLSFSGEYMEKTEAPTILLVLKSMVARLAETVPAD